MSAALTAGVAALIRASYPRLTAAAVTQAVERGATAAPGTGQSPAGWGHGELSATAALTAAAELAAAQPSPTPTVSAVAVPLAVPLAVTSAAPTATSSKPDPGHLLRSLVTGLAIVAGVLIACLIGVTALTRSRRRGRAGTHAGLARTSRQGHRGGHARHARPRGAAAAAPVPPATGAWSPAQTRRPRLAEEPPWPPALPPGNEAPVARPPARALPPPRTVPSARVLPPARTLPAAPPEAKPADTPLAPWEQSPADFAKAPPQPDDGSWPVSSTGPMYVWNPSATGPLQAVEEDDS
jgi:hypothetical protein